MDSGWTLVEGSKRTNDQVWEEMRRLQRLGIEAEGAREKAAESLKQAQISPFEGLPDKVGWLSLYCCDGDVRSAFSMISDMVSTRVYNGDCLHQPRYISFTLCSALFRLGLSEKFWAKCSPPFRILIWAAGS